MCWLKDLVEFHKKPILANNIPLELEKITSPCLWLFMTTLFKTKMYSNQQKQGIRDENINSDTDVKPVSEKLQAK